MREYRKWTSGEMIELKRMLKDNIPRPQIAEALKVNRGRLEGKLREMGLVERRRTFGKDEDKFIEESREISFPWRLIAQTLDRPENTCKNRYRKLILTNPRRYDGEEVLPDRPCSMCREDFPPKSKFIFVCNDCKDTDVWKGRGGMG